MRKNFPSTPFGSDLVVRPERFKTNNKFSLIKIDKTSRSSIAIPRKKGSRSDSNDIKHCFVTMSLLFIFPFPIFLLAIRGKVGREIAATCCARNEAKWIFRDFSMGDFLPFYAPWENRFRLQSKRRPSTLLCLLILFQYCAKPFLTHGWQLLGCLHVVYRCSSK